MQRARRTAGCVKTIPDDLFPEAPRVIYERAPLVQVACELRFPTILRIQSQPPAEFQDRIKARFPLVETATSPFANQLSSSFPLPPISQQGPPLPPEIAQLLGAAAGPSYVFLTRDRKFSLALEAQRLSLSTKSYTHWDDFRHLVLIGLREVVDIYEPALFTRIGLRYTNAIDRGRLSLSDVPWPALLKKEILGEIVLPPFDNNTVAATRVTIIRDPNGIGSMTFRHGLGTIQGRNEVGYLMDFDIYTDQQTETGDAESILDRFAERGWRAFRWAITDTLHDALGPRELVLEGTKPG